MKMEIEAGDSWDTVGRAEVSHICVFDKRINLSAAALGGGTRMAGKGPSSAGVVQDLAPATKLHEVERFWKRFMNMYCTVQKAGA